MKFLIWALLAVSTTACNFGNPFVERTARFVGNNRSSFNVVAMVNDGTEYPIPANRSVGFEVKIMVPQNPANSDGFGPSTIDKTVQVTVVFRNLVTGNQTSYMPCWAGAKVVTTIEYEVASHGQEQTRCSWTSPY